MILGKVYNPSAFDVSHLYSRNKSLKNLYY